MIIILTFFIVFIIFLCIIFLIKKKEGFTDNSQPRCPNLLIQKGAAFYLYNTELAEVPGVNPIEFHNLEEYVEFLKWQHSVGIRCPVLYLQQSYDTQNNRIYKIRPSVTEIQAGLPPIKQSNNTTLLVDASRDDKPYNINSFPGIDTKNQYIGKITPLDVESNFGLNNQTDNAMSDDWNPIIAQQNIDKGVYANDNVQIYVP